MSIGRTKIKFPVVVLIAVSVVLSGCVSLDRQAFNRSANPHIKTVSIPKPVNPETYSVNILHHPGASFGLIGGLIAAAELSTKSSGVTDAIKTVGFDPGQALSEAIKAALEKQNQFAVTLVPGPTRKEGAFIEDYNTVEGAGDAVLDTAISYIGYWASSHSAPYYPTLSVATRLVDMRTKAILYNAMFVYGPVPIVPTGVTKMIPGPEFMKPDYDALLANKEELVGGLKYAIGKVAESVALDLK